MLSIVVPVYNEEKRILKTLKSYDATFSGAEIVFVCNGCRDKSAEIIESFNAKNTDKKLYIFSDKLGKGGAIIEGLKKCSGDVLGFTDADESFNVEKLRDCIYSMHSDCMIASKWKGIPFNRVDEPFMRKVFSRGWNIIVRLLFGLHYSDTQAGAKFMKRCVYESISENFFSRGFEFDIEMLWRIKVAGYKISEVFIPSSHIEGSTFRYSEMWKMMKSILIIRFRHSFVRREANRPRYQAK